MVTNLAPNIQSINTSSLNTIIFNFMEKKRKSLNTYNAYNRYYNEFFQFGLGKDLESLTWEDIFSITYSDVERYQLYMTNEKGLSFNTANQKLFALKSLWNALHRHNNAVNTDILDFEELESEDNSYASFTTDEIDLLLDFAKNRQYKGKVQSLLFEFLFVVGCRKNVPLTLTKDMIMKNYDFNMNKEVWVVRFWDKGKIVDKAINDEFYDKLVSIYENNANKVFNVGAKTIEETFDNFRKKYNLYEKNGKKLTIHSIKKASGWLGYKMTGDINATKEHLQHEHLQTTSKDYLNGKDNYCSQISYMLGNTIDMKCLNALTREEILTIIEKCGKDVLYKMWFEAKKLNLI